MPAAVRARAGMTVFTSLFTHAYHRCRCLKTCTRLLRDFVPKGETIVAAEAAEAVFKKASLYYPITFTPPPNDPYRITPVSAPNHAMHMNIDAHDALPQYRLNPIALQRLNHHASPFTITQASSSFVFSRAWPTLPQAQLSSALTDCLFASDAIIDHTVSRRHAHSFCVDRNPLSCFRS